MTSTPCPSEMAFSLRATEPDVFHSMVKMHLSFLLDLSTDDCDCSFIMDPAVAATPGKSGHGDKDSLAKRIFTPKKFLSSGHQSAQSSSSSSSSTSSKGVMDGATLTMEGVCQVFQLVDYLRAERNLTTVGIFRKHGNLRKQQALKERLNRGVVINLDDGEFSVHECAAVLKSFLAELPEPLLTDACYKAHCQVNYFFVTCPNSVLNCYFTDNQVARLVGRSQDTADEEQVREKCVACLQLLFLLIPQPNYNFLKDLLGLLKKVASMEEANKMSSANLGTMFAPLILCPRKLSAESLQSNHQLLTRAVAYMVDNAEAIFEMPARLHNDIEMYLKNKANRPKPAVQAATPLKGVGPDGRPQSPVVNTIYSFVDKEKTSKASAQTSTEAALAELYAHVQSLPESAHKKKLVAKLNDANGQGTPGVHKGAFRKRNDGIKSLLTPKRSSKRSQDEGKIGRHGSYNLQADFKTPGKAPSQLLHSFRRQKSESAGDEEKSKLTQSVSQKLLSPQSSPALLVSPSTIDTIAQRQEIKHSAKKTSEIPTEVTEPTQNLDGSYEAPPPPAPSVPSDENIKRPPPPPVPERVSSLNRAKADGTDEDVTGVSPISCYARTMPSDMQKSIMTPRSRRPVQVAPDALPKR